MGVYSNLEILRGIAERHIICYPLIEDNIRGSSIDITLGHWFYECDASTFPDAIFNPFDPTEVDRYFRLRQAEDFAPRQLTGIPADHPVILVKPRSRILAHSHEFVGIHPPGTTEMRARSSWGRNGIAVCLCAGWGDPGYINRWTMEIHNHNDEAVPLPVGERIAQMIFHRTGEVSGHYGSGSNGKYQSSEDVAEIVHDWTPEAMLPRAYKDERVLPLSVYEEDPSGRS